MTGSLPSQVALFQDFSGCSLHGGAVRLSGQEGFQLVEHWKRKGSSHSPTTAAALESGFTFAEESPCFSKNQEKHVDCRAGKNDARCFWSYRHVQSSDLFCQFDRTLNKDATCGILPAKQEKTQNYQAISIVSVAQKIKSHKLIKPFCEPAWQLFITAKLPQTGIILSLEIHLRPIHPPFTHVAASIPSYTI